jgi:hypothetical protein
MKEIMYSYVKGKGWVASYVPQPGFTGTRQASKVANFGIPGGVTTVVVRPTEVRPGDYIMLDLDDPTRYGQWARTRR